MQDLYLKKMQKTLLINIKNLINRETYYTPSQEDSVLQRYQYSSNKGHI